MLRKLNLLQPANIRLQRLPKKPPPIVPRPRRITLQRLHRQRKCRQLRRPLINLNPKQILSQNQLRNRRRVIPRIQINRKQQIISINQHMPRSTSRITHPQLLRRTDFQKIRLRRLRLNVIIHLFNNPRLRVIQQPQPPQRILHQIPHNPMRRKQLRRRRNIRRRNLLILLQPVKHLILLLRDIKLIQPANHLNTLTRHRGQRLPRISQNRMIRQQIIRHQQPGIIINPRKQIRH